MRTGVEYFYSLIFYFSYGCAINLQIFNTTALHEMSQINSWVKRILKRPI